MNLRIPVNERDHMIGPANAPITLVNYGDYECPDCHRRHREVEKMFDQLVNAVCFVYRHFPLVRVHPRALRAAEASEAAAAQGRFWEMHRHLYTQPDKLDDRHLHRYAREVGLDLARFDSEMAAGTYTDLVLSGYHNGLIYGITGAPTTFINGELYAMTDVDLLSTVRTMLE